MDPSQNSLQATERSSPFRSRKALGVAMALAAAILIAVTGIPSARSSYDTAATPSRSAGGSLSQDAPEYRVTIPATSYNLGDIIPITVQYHPNTEVWAMINGELSSVVKSKTNASGVAALSMNVGAPHFVAGSSGTNQAMIGDLSVWSGDIPLRVAHAFVAIGTGYKCELVNVAVTADRVTGYLRRVGVASGLALATIHAWGDDGDKFGETDANGYFDIAVANAKYVVFLGYIFNTVYHAGCVYNADTSFNAAYSRITEMPLGIEDRGANGDYDSGRTIFFAWNVVNPKSGVYDWSSIQKEVDAAVKGGYEIAISVSFYYATPAGTPPMFRLLVPMWVLEGSPGYIMTSGGRTAWLPPYNKPGFQEAYTDMIAALAAEFDGDAGVAFIAVGPGIDNEAVLTKDAGGVRWMSDGIYRNYCTANEYEVFKAIAYDAHLAFATTPVVWYGKRPNTREAFQLAHDGVLYKTNGYTEKGQYLRYGGTQTSYICVDSLEGLVPGGAETKNGAVFSGSQYDGVYPTGSWNVRDLSGHFYTLASLMMHGNRLITAHPEYLEGPLLAQSPFRDWYLRALSKTNTWWLILREIPATDDVSGATLRLPSNGLAPQRGPLGFKMAVTGGTLVTRAQWLATDLPRSKVGAELRIQNTFIDCPSIEAYEAPAAWVGKFPRIGRMGEVTLHLLGAPIASDYQAYIAFYGKGGFTFGGVAVPLLTAPAMQHIRVENLTPTAGVYGSEIVVNLTVGADENYLVFCDIWRAP